MKPRILMCRPDHFGVCYSINPWMDPAAWAAQDRVLATAALRQWFGLRGLLTTLGARIELVPEIAGLPDLVFTANAAVVMDGKALLARFRHPERRREEAHTAQAFRVLQATGLVSQVETLPEGIVLEGAGDCVWDPSRRLFWLGHGQRSDRIAAASVEAAFGLEAVALELADPRFYHMDTALAPLPHGEILYVPEAFTETGRAEIRARVAPDLRIELSPEDARLFAANAVCLGDDIVLSRCGSGLKEQLEDRGYHVHQTPLDAFQRSGGSAFCLTLRLDRRSAPVAVTVAEPAPRHLAFG